jgi:polar amino acid transport system substrate-binding protein
LIEPAVSRQVASSFVAQPHTSRRSTLASAARPLITALLALTVFVGCDNGQKTIEKPEDAEDARLALMTGSTSEIIAATRFPDAQIQRFDDPMDAVLAVKTGKVDAFITGHPSALLVVQKNPDLQVIDSPLSAEDTSIGVRKGNEELLEAVNGVIDQLRADGTLADMSRRWVKAQPGPYDEPQIEAVTSGKVLRIGVSATREPTTFVDQTGRVTGHDGELARRIGLALQRPVEFADMRFMSLIPALESGKIDLIVTGMSATTERRKRVDFSHKYFDLKQVLLVRRLPGEATAAAPAAPRIATLADLADKRIGVLLGSAHDTYAQRTYPRAEILQFQATADMMLAVSTAKADAGIIDEDMLREAQRNNPVFQQLGEPLFTLPVGAGFRKGDPLRGRFDELVAGLNADGTMADMVQRWVKQNGSSMPAITGATTRGEPVLIGTSSGGLPFGAVKDGRLVGFDIEIAERFAASIGRPVKFVDMEFGSLIAALSAGKIDLICASMYITEERQKRIDFSQPYYRSASYAFIAAAPVATPVATAAGPVAAAPGFFADVAESFHNNIVHEKRYLLLWDGLKATVLISVLATLFGTAVAGLICFMRMSPRAVLNVPAQAYIAVLRGTPVLVLLMLIFYVVFASVDINPMFVAVIAFGLNFGAYVAEILRSGIEGVDPGQGEAGVSLGFTPAQTFRHVVLPQTLVRILPVYKGEFISMVKMTSIVGYIAVQDLTKASDIIRSRTFDAFFPLVMIAVMYFAISWLLMQGLTYLERVTDPKYRRRQGGRA